ncbi:MAG: hypothetical protein WC595_03840 [Candidatus Nanoarchaeia archaeon]
MHSKKGDVWVSAILYFGLGIIIITIMLTAATPVINKLRDKNIIIQTKDIFQVIDANIREVAREGPGAQRPLTVDVRKGEFSFPNAGAVQWKYESKALIADVCVRPPAPALPLADDACPQVREGNVRIVVRPGNADKSYDTKLQLNYTGVLYVKYGEVSKTVAGNTALVIRNFGASCGSNADERLNFIKPLRPCLPNTASTAQNPCYPANTCQCNPAIANTVVAGCPTPLPTVEIVQR